MDVVSPGAAAVTGPATLDGEGRGLFGAGNAPASGASSRRAQRAEERAGRTESRRLPLQLQRAPAAQQLEQRAHAEAGGARRLERRDLLGVRDGRDVEMDPRCVADEVREERARRDR